MTKGILIVAGQELHAAIEAEKLAKVPRDGELFRSEPLCVFHRELSGRGILGAQMVESIYGWGVRYDSGLQNFGILAGARQRNVDGSYTDALAFAERWVAEDPTRRYVWVYESELAGVYLAGRVYESVPAPTVR